MLQRVKSWAFLDPWPKRFYEFNFYEFNRRQDKEAN